MAEETPTTPAETPAPAPAAKWRHLWQLPAIVAGAAISVGAIMYAVRTTPRVDHGAGLVEAASQLDSGKFEDALGTLNARVLPHMADGGLTKDQQRRFYLLRARAIYLGQKDLGISREENNKNILAEYRQAEEQGAELTGQDKAFRCNTLVSLGEFEKALHEMEELPADEAAARRLIHRRLIDAALAGGPSKGEAALDLITRFMQETDLSDEERLWGLDRQGKMLLAAKMPEEAVTRILRAMPRLENASGPAVGEVLVTLGQAYFDLDQVQRAGAQLERAAQLLGPVHELMPKVTRMLAQIDQAVGGDALSRARDRYQSILTDWEHSPEVPRALLGLAEVESGLSNLQTPALINDSLKHYGQLVSLIRGEPVDFRTSPEEHAGEHVDEHAPASKPAEQHADATSADHAATPEVKAAAEHEPAKAGAESEPLGQAPHVDPEMRQATLASLLARFVEQFDKKDFHLALQFADQGRALVGVDDAPQELLLGLARTHRELAAEILRRAGGGSALTLAKADPSTQHEAREHLLKAGEFYRLHAAKCVQTDSQSYGNSLWAAADMFDRAGDLSGSASAFQQFAADFPGDSRKPEALFRLAEAHRAGGNMEEAAKLYRDLIAAGSTSREAGPVASASHVPLAKTLLQDNKPENDGDAEQELLRVVRGEIGGTATPMFREALRTLGEYYYDSGQYERAIERLGEYIERSRMDRDSVAADSAPAANGEAAVIASNAAPRPSETEDGETLGLFYKLADAHRQSAKRIQEGFAVAMPDSQRRDLEKARRERLERGMSLFDSVQQSYDRLAHRTALDELRLRNAAFFKADCAFDLGEYETSIRLYDAAKERYPRDAASLVAMVQIVAALLEQGKTQEAATANVRARKFYESLPESAWDDPSLPMSRRQWEQWLDAQTALAGTPETQTAPGER